MLLIPGRHVVASALVSALTLVSLSGTALAQKPASSTGTAPSTSGAAATKPAAKPAGTGATATASTDDAKKDEEKKDDDKKDEKPKKNGLLFNLEFGLTRTGLAGFSDSLDFDKTAANGLLYGLGAGVRLGDIRLGARFRSNSTTEFTLWSLMLEAGYGIKLQPLEPIFSLHVGYAWNQELERATISSSLPPGNLLKPEVDLHSLLLGAEVNALYSINETVKIGPFIGFDFLIVQRNQVDFPQSIFPGGTSAAYKEKPLYNEEGHSVGYNLNLGIRGVLDFGF